MLVTAAPRHFFVPPYIGSRGWVGVELNLGLSLGTYLAIGP